MKKTIIILFLLLLSNMLFSITVDGYAYLENQTIHDNIKVVFERSVPSSLTDSTYTASNGYYTIDIETGIYNISYSKENFHPFDIYDEILYSNTTLSDITLLGSPTTINVPSYIPTIQEAIDFSLDGDTILVQPGIYVENINFNGKNITIASLYLTTQDTSYISQTIIDGDSIGSVVTFESGEDSTAVLCGFTITNGCSYWGGGIYCEDNSSPSLENITITGNNALGNGGGVCCDHSSPNLDNVTITNNTASLIGGGIYCWDYSSPSFKNVTISGNTAYMSGGICCDHHSSPILDNVTITGNTASDIGGGIYCCNSSPILTGVTITSNSAYMSGGIYCDSNSSPILDNVTITDNTASLNGGGIYCEDNSSPILDNVTIASNTANFNGGGIYCSDSSPSLVNSIVSNNTGNYGIYVYSGNPLISYSDFFNNENGNFFNCGQWIGVNIATNANGDSCDAYYNIQLEPCFVDTANGDYHLASDSPCIDAGDPSSPLDPDGTISDMGAYYYNQNRPSADFIANITNGTVPLIIDFSDISTMGLSGNPILEWYWDFDNDGLIDSQIQNPQWTYYERGNYTVTLTVFDGNYEDTEIKENYISLLNSAPITQNPLIDFSFDEDTSDSSIDLFSVFDDPDLPYGDSLSFSYSGNDSILIEILNGVVTLTPLPDWFGAENITFTATDDSLVFISDDVLVTVINVNDPPEINFPDNFTFYEDSLETYDFTQYITDIDNSLNELSLTWSGNDTINIVQDGWNITFSSNVQNWNGMEEVTFFVNDNSDYIRIAKNHKIREKLKSEFTDDIVSETIDVICVPVNDPPTIILPDDFTFAEDSTLVEDFAVYIDDVDPDELTLSVTGNTEITVDIAGTIVTFGATENWNGSETLIFTVDDNQTRAFASDSVDVIVTPVNDPPTIILPDDFTFAEDSTLVEDFAAYIDDVDPDVLTLSVTGNTEITVEISGTIVTFGATENWNGTETLIFTVDDNQTRAFASDSVDVIVTPVNDPPTIILPDDFTFAEDSTLVEDFAVYIDDVDPDELTLSVTGNTEITVDIAGTIVTFGAAENWNGTETLTFTVDDNQTRASASDSVDVIVTPVNDPPTIILPDDFTFVEDSTLVEDFAVYIDDVDPDVLTLSVTGNIEITVGITGTIVTFGASVNWNGTETLTFTVDDNQTRATASDSVDVIVTPVNDPPTIILPDYFTFTEDSTLVEDFAVYIDDVDPDELTLSVTGNTEITVDIAGTIVTFGAAENWNGTETLTFTVDDNQTRATASDSVDVIVTPVNDPPTIVLPDDFTFAEDSTLVEDFAVYIDDVDPDELTLSVTGNTEITVDIAGTIVTFGAAENWNGTETLTFTVDDNQTRATASDSVDVIVTPVNDPPTIILPDDFTFAEDSTLVEDFAVYIDDVDPDELTLSVTGNTEITVDITGTIVTFGASENWNGNEILTFIVNDNQTRATASDSVDVIVMPVNDPPVLIVFSPEELEFTVYQDSIVTFFVEVEDIDSDLIYAWFVNNDIQTEISDTFIYQFSLLGEFEIESEVSDEEYQIDTIWDVTVEEQVGTENLIPAVTELRNNYPNPFNPSGAGRSPETTIEYSLKEPGNICLEIYNIRGQKVNTLVNEFKDVGYHHIIWNGTDDNNQPVGTGVYLYRLKIDDKTVATKKCLLLK